MLSQRREGNFTECRPRQHLQHHQALQRELQVVNSDHRHLHVVVNMIQQRIYVIQWISIDTDTTIFYVLCAVYCTALYLYSSLSWLSGVLRPDFIINTFCAARWLRQSNTNQEGLEINKLPSASVFIYHSFSQRATPGQKSVWNFQSVLSLAAGDYCGGAQLNYQAACQL